MRDVVIIGGGLTGLAAAFELERLKIPYRLIEVKRRLGGSIHSERRDGFLVDSGPFTFHQDDDWSFLPDIGLEPDFIPAYDSHDRALTAFRGGTQALIDALTKPIGGTLIHRMAVSSLGESAGQFTLCLENGLIWNAGALIVAAPARHTERMFRTLAPELALKLLDYPYDTITRINLGYREDDLTSDPSFPWDMAMAFYSWVDDESRVPPGHVLLQVGVRIPPHFAHPERLVDHLHERLGATAPPVFSHSAYWEDADPLPPHFPEFSDQMRELQALLPEKVALAGSDYDGLSLAERIRAGQQAARRIAARW